MDTRNHTGIVYSIRKKCIDNNDKLTGIKWTSNDKIFGLHKMTNMKIICSVSPTSSSTSVNTNTKAMNLFDREGEYNLYSISSNK
ncbi:hypothetical protein Bhyg_01856 [Pseudolycoriella hygida]|uniref:Uncharacterized protein n=1 Tax=Pseudolycoriella hygida TaxID=35572 RepID=A0A9Q0S791_9DIPT|nr:hypothetical protein Bhyg_01856 [Pseudolycoriella hygida]